MTEFLNNLVTMTLFGYVWLFWVYVIIGTIFLFISDVSKNGWFATIVFIAFMVITHYQLNVNYTNVFNVWNIVLYLCIGLIYAMIRTYFLGVESKKEFEYQIKYFTDRFDVFLKDKRSKENDLPKKVGLSDDDEFYKYSSLRRPNIEDIKNNTKYELKNNVFRWWLLFPISSINWVLSDVVRNVYTFVYNKLSKTFDFIYDIGFGK